MGEFCCSVMIIINNIEKNNRYKLRKRKNADAYMGEMCENDRLTGTAFFDHMKEMSL